MGSLEWISPTRRIGRRELAPIPNEVYLEIFSYFEPSEATSQEDCRLVLSNLALVCRFFGAFAVSRIYRTLVFSGCEMTPGLAPFCRSLAGNMSSSRDSELAINVAGLVRELVFKNWSEEDEGSVWGAFLNLYLNAVRKLPKVECIRLESTTITENLVRAITKSTKSTLNGLYIRSCPFSIDAASETSRLRLNSLNLRALEYFPLSCASVQLPPSTFRLRELEVFRTDSWSFGYFFIRRQHPSLRVLELHNVEDVPALFNFLAKCPTITDLSLRSICLNPRLPIPAGGLPHTSLANLSALTIPPTLLPHFSRPTLRKVSLAGWEMRQWAGDVHHNPVLPLFTPREMAPLMPPAAALTQMNIHVHIYFALPDFHRTFRGLRVLFLAYTHPNFATDVGKISTPELFRAEVNRIGSKWVEATAQRHPIALRELRLDFISSSPAKDGQTFTWMWDLSLQQEMSLSLSHVSALTRIVFTPFVVWEAEEGNWRAWVPHTMRKFVKDKLAKGVRYVDVGGCLANLNW